jgi:predicted ATPase/DNA-binding CsgD family transcriptional regulator
VAHTESFTTGRHNRLIGRTTELARARDFLTSGRAQSRLLTIAGEPGIGKTRLALELAADLRQHFEGRVYFVPLESVERPELVETELAQCLGVEVRGAGALEAAIDVLGVSPALLILDSFDHLRAAHDTVATLLEHCRRLRIVVTSRARLHIAAEYVIRLGSLSVAGGEGAADSEAVQYFVERARMAAHDVTFDSPDDVAAIVEICRRLDGIPLALELAARRVGVLRTPRALLRRLEWGLLPVLVDGPSDWPARHRTMEAAIHWGHRLLSPADQAVLGQLSVFPDAFTADAAAAVLNASSVLSVDPLDSLETQVNSGFARSEEDDNGRPRFRISQVVREYAHAWLEANDKIDEAEHRYLSYALHVAEVAGEQILRSKQISWLARLERELTHVRWALRWADENDDAATGLTLAVALTLFWSLRGRVAEGRAWLNTFRHRADDVSANLRARALAADGVLAAFASSYAEALTILLAASSQLRELGNVRALAWTLLWLGNVSVDLGDPERARGYYEQSLEVFVEVDDQSGAGWSQLGLGNVARLGGKDVREWTPHFEEAYARLGQIDDAWGTGTALRYLANVAYKCGDYDRSAELYKECVRRFRELGFCATIAWTLNAWADVERCRMRYTSAQDLYDEALALFNDLRIEAGSAWVKHNLAYIALSRGDLAAAAELLRESLVSFSAAGFVPGTAACLAGCAQVALARDDALSAARLLGAAHRLVPALEPVDQLQFDRAWTETRRRLGNERQGLEWAAGRQLGIDEACELAKVTIDPGVKTGSARLRTAAELTPREREVVTFIAAGYKDREIAEALVMTRATASWHVRNVLSKLDLTRSQVGIWALREGLLEPRLDRSG